MTSNVEKIGLRLGAARRVVYKSARDFATKYSIAESTYSQHETGKRSLSVHTLLQYSEWLGVDSGWLLTGKGVPYPNQQGTTEKLASLYHYLHKADKDALFEMEQQCLIRGDYAVVDIPLFKTIVEKLFVLWQQHDIDINESDALSMMIDIYNSVVRTSADEEDRRRMIDLSVNSLLIGLTSHKQTNAQQVG